MKFTLTAENKEGETYTEPVEAPDRFAVYREVRARGDALISLEEEKSARRARFGSLRSLAPHSSFFGGISGDDLVVLARNLSAMLEAGLTATRALAVMERQSRNARLKTLLEEVSADVKRGGALAAALAKFPRDFPPLMVSMVKAGEESGKLSESLRVVAIQLERASDLKKKIRGALIYPSIVVVAMLAIGVLMLIYVVPTLSKTFSELGAELPFSTRLIIGASDFLLHQWALALALVLALSALLVGAARASRGKRVLDWLWLHSPLIAEMVRETNSARTARTLSSLLSAGVEVVSSLSITEEVVANSYYREVLAEAGRAVTKGGPISEAFAKHPELYPPLVAEMLAVGEETGRISELLRETAEFYEESVERETKDLSAVVEPLLILFIGAGVGFFAISMIAPIYALSSALG